MSIGLFLISFRTGHDGDHFVGVAAPDPSVFCFLGFAIGESLGGAQRCGSRAASSPRSPTSVPTS